MHMSHVSKLIAILRAKIEATYFALIALMFENLQTVSIAAFSISPRAIAG